MWHAGLLYKLNQKGVTGPLFLWLQSYLKNRKQRVVIKGQTSDWKDVAAGVPQGSILGPLLFLVYVDDIVKDIQTDIYLFADDTSLIEYISNPITSFENLSADLHRLHIWSKSWLVTFNPTKTAYVVFSKKLYRQAHPDLYLGDVKLTESSKHKQLGVVFNNNITFDDHIDQQCKKAMSRLTALKRVQHRLPRQSQLNIYLSFIRPVLEFGWQLYDNSSGKALKKLENVQREALLSITRAYKKTSHVSLLNETGVEMLSNRRKSRKKQFMYKHSTNALPQYLRSIIPETVSSKTTYGLRNQYDINAPRSKKNYLLKSFIPSSIDSWNDLDLETRNLPTYEGFKKKMEQMYGNSSYSMFMYGDTNGSINHSRIRMGLSGLNAHRKKVNFIRDAACGYCTDRSESPCHYFFQCPAFAAQRQDLFHDLNTIDNLNVPNSATLLNRNHAKVFLGVLLNGSGNITVDTYLFDYVQAYITNTQRFV